MSNPNRKYVSEGGSFNNLDDIGGYEFDNDIESTIGVYVNEAISSIDGANANLFSSSEYVNLERDSYKENTYSLFELDKLSINLADYRTSSASLYKYFKILEPDSTYQLTTSEPILIDGLHFAVEGNDGIKEKTNLVKITNPESDGKRFVIKTPTDRATYFYGRFTPAHTTKVKLRIKLETGHNPTLWTPSINDISNAILEHDKFNKENNEVINDLKNKYNEFITNNGVTNIAEVKFIENYINIVNVVMMSIKASYEVIKESPYIINTNEKRTLIKNYDKLIKAQTDMATVINGIINNNKITPSEKDDVNASFDKFNQTIYNYQISYEKTKNLVDSKLKGFNSNHLNDSFFYRLVISSTNGTIFKNKDVKTTLNVKIFKNNKNITDDVDNIKFKWSRYSGDNNADKFWGKANNVIGKSIDITTKDVFGKATFICETTINGLTVTDSCEITDLSIKDDIEDGVEGGRGSVTFFSKPTKYKKGDRWVLTEDTRLLDNFYKKGQALEAVYATGNDSDWRLLIFASETDGVNLIRNYNFKEQTIAVGKTHKTIIPNWDNTPKEAIVLLDDEIPTEYYNTSINVIGDEYGANYVITSENGEMIIFDE